MDFLFKEKKILKNTCSIFMYSIKKETNSTYRQFKIASCVDIDYFLNQT